MSGRIGTVFGQGPFHHHDLLLLSSGVRRAFYTPMRTDQAARPSQEKDRTGKRPPEAVAHALNNRPRKILDWKTPAEVFEEELRSLQPSGVATTG